MYILIFHPDVPARPNIHLLLSPTCLQTNLTKSSKSVTGAIARYCLCIFSIPLRELLWSICPNYSPLLLNHLIFLWHNKCRRISGRTLFLKSLLIGSLFFQPIEVLVSFRIWNHASVGTYEKNVMRKNLIFSNLCRLLGPLICREKLYCIYRST